MKTGLYETKHEDKFERLFKVTGSKWKVHRKRTAAKDFRARLFRWEISEKFRTGSEIGSPIIILPLYQLQITVIGI
jgi:hypothetical protein